MIQKVLIVEDEPEAARRLETLMVDLIPGTMILAKLDSVKRALSWLAQHPAPDLIFMDIQLADGLSFEIFKQAGVKTPVIFTTCYDKFMLLAFENNGIDYILKPIEKTDIQKAIWKYKNLQNHFEQHGQQMSMTKLMGFINGRSKSRILVKRGMDNILLRLEDIILFYTENKVVFVIDRFSKKYILDKTLSELEEELDSQLFFRANRQYIININFVKSFKAYKKVKLLVDIDIPELEEPVIISQHVAPAFKKWMEDA